MTEPEPQNAQQPQADQSQAAPRQQADQQQSAPQHPGEQYPQPQFTFTPQPPMPIKNHVGWAIAGILLFWPLGIPALIKCVEVAPLWYQGNYRGAEDSSRAAKSWGKAGVIAGAVLYGLLLVFMIAYIVFMFYMFSTMQQDMQRF